jgi:transposase-like protein
MARRRPGSRWSPEQRAKALELYTTTGLADAHRATGIAKSTIVTWAREDGLEHAAERSAAKEQTAAATAEAGEILAASVERRQLQLATAAELALEELLNRLENEADRAKIPPRDLVGIFTRSNHDLALLTGQATEHQAVTVLFNVPEPDPTPPTVIAQDDLPALGQ